MGHPQMRIRPKQSKAKSKAKSKATSKAVDRSVRSTEGRVGESHPFDFAQGRLLRKEREKWGTPSPGTLEVSHPPAPKRGSSYGVEALTRLQQPRQHRLYLNWSKRDSSLRHPRLG